MYKALSINVKYCKSMYKSIEEAIPWGASDLGLGAFTAVGPKFNPWSGS